MGDVAHIDRARRAGVDAPCWHRTYDETACLSCVVDAMMRALVADGPVAVLPGNIVISLEEDVDELSGEPVYRPTADADLAAGTTCADHVEGPDGYSSWHEWAKKMSETHHQRRCAECGLWKIWQAKS